MRRFSTFNAELGDAANVDEYGCDEPDFTVEPAVELIVETTPSWSLEKAL